MKQSSVKYYVFKNKPITNFLIELVELVELNDNL